MLPGEPGALQHAPRRRDLGGGKEGGSGLRFARVRRDRLRAGGATLGSGCERPPDHFHHRHCQGDERGDRRVDLAGEVWGDAGAGDGGRRVDVQENGPERFNLVV